MILKENKINISKKPISRTNGFNRIVKEDYSNLEVSKVADFLKKSVDDLTGAEIGITYYSLAGGLYIVVGWSAGFDEKDEKLIHSKESPTYCLVAGIKFIPHNAYDFTDYDSIYFPYEKDGTVYDYEFVLEQDEDYNELAKALLDNYDKIKDLELDDDGMVIATKEYDENYLGEKVKKCAKGKCLKDIKEDYDEDKIEEAVNYYIDFECEYLDDMRALVENLVERVSDLSSEKSIYNAIGDGLIYYSDQWLIMQYYQEPRTADFDSAEELLFNDLVKICDRLSGKDLDENCKHSRKAKQNGLTEDDTGKKCCICGKDIQGWGNNALPVKDGICCDECNEKKVIPARIVQLYKNKGTKTEQKRVNEDLSTSIDKFEQSHNFTFDERVVFENAIDCLIYGYGFKNCNTDNLEDKKRAKEIWNMAVEFLGDYDGLLEDTKKLKNGKWANVGKDGKVDSGTFKTKKEADAQRRAMFANKK